MQLLASLPLRKPLCPEMADGQDTQDLFQQLIDELQEDLGRPPKPAELAEATGLEVAEAKAVLKELKPAAKASKSKRKSPQQEPVEAAAASSSAAPEPVAPETVERKRLRKAAPVVVEPCPAEEDGEEEPEEVPDSPVGTEFYENPAEQAVNPPGWQSQLLGECSPEADEVEIGRAHV